MTTEEARSRALLNTHPRAEHLAAQKKTEKFKIAVSAGQKKKWENPEYQERMSRIQRELWEDPVIAAKRIEGLESTRDSEERKEAARIGVRKPETQAKRIAALQKNKLAKKLEVYWKTLKTLQASLHDVSVV
jgi:hypothetical protein